MIHNGDCLQDVFVAGSEAPSALSAVNPYGLIIPNAIGTVCLSPFDVDERTSTIDHTTEPPTLRLLDAPTRTLFGSGDQTGLFSRILDETDTNDGMVLVTGNYTGPGSVLHIQRF